jgi:hypothetical protein
MTIDQAQTMLEQMVNDLPEAIFQDLNGGVLLLPQAKRSPEARADDLYIMGEYVVRHDMGRMVKIYYGSFVKLFGENAPDAKWEKELRHTLHHELTHHLEHLAGENDLEVEDDIRMYLYHNNMDMSQASEIMKNLKKK